MVERDLFIGPQIPAEVRKMIKLLPNIEKISFRKIIQAIVALLEGNEVASEEKYKLLREQLNMKDNFDILFAGLYSLLKYALRVPLESLKQESFKEDLKEMNIPIEFASDLATVVFGSRRNAIDEHTIKKQPKMPSVREMKWRVDVTISTSHLNKVLEPSILMELSLSDDTTKKFEIPVSQFHKLRHDVAHLLQEMEELEKRNIFKIQDK